VSWGRLKRRAQKKKVKTVRGALLREARRDGVECQGEMETLPSIKNGKSAKKKWDELPRGITQKKKQLRRKHFDKREGRKGRPYALRKEAGALK